MAEVGPDATVQRPRGRCVVPLTLAGFVAVGIGWASGWEPAASVPSPRSARPSSPSALPAPLPVSRGRKRYVSPTGSDSGPGTLRRPWRTINRAARSLRPGETVYVRAGVYTEDVVVNKAGTPRAPITIRNHPGERPVIHPTGSGSLDYPVRITAGAAYVRFHGFVIEGAQADGIVNVYISDGQQSQPQAAHNIEFSGNEVRSGMGTGLLVAPNTDSVQLLGNWIHDNGTGTAHQHQGIYFQGQNGLIANNLVTTQPHGFGIQVRGENSRIIAHNIIVTSNTTADNRLAGIVVESTAANVSVVNNIAAFNGTYGIWGYACCGTNQSGNQAWNNLLFGNARGSVTNSSSTAVLDLSRGNIDGDPRFVDRAAGNYRLERGSPGIDRALAPYAPQRDRQGLARPQGRRPDIGAYERLVRAKRH